MSFYYSKEFVIWDAKYLGFHTKVLMNTTSERLRVLWNDAIASYRSRGIFTIGEQILIYCKKKKSSSMLCLYLTERWRDTFTWSRLWQFGAQLGWSRLSFRRNLSENSPSFRAQSTGQSIFREQANHCIILRVKRQCHYVDNDENLWEVMMVLILMKKTLI